MKKGLYFILFLLMVVPSLLHAQNLDLYYLELSENNNKDSVAFTSLSDKYDYRENADFPDLEDMDKNDAEYIKLNSIYKKDFLSIMKISETDKVFIYDYSTSILKSFPVKMLNVVACLNIYGAEWPYSQRDYMIGFEINIKFLKGVDKHFNDCLVYVGKKSPFVVGQLKPVRWTKIESKYFPSIPISSENNLTISQYKCIPGDAYEYKTDSLQYFVQEYVGDSKVRLSARRVLVINLKTKKMICERIYFESEGASPAPLNNTEPYPDIYQWTGKLFKNKPPVIFGFKFISFGCESITFLDPNEKDIYVNCDNRH